MEAPAIPPFYFDRPYYLEPARGGERGYALFREALRRSDKVAVASVVVKTRQHLAAVLVHDPRDASATPAYFVLLQWSDGRVGNIKEFRYARYANEGAEFLFAS